MGGFWLLHNPWIQFYLVYVAALSVVFLWDCLRPQPATRNVAPPPNAAAPGGTSLPPRSQKPSAVGVAAGARAG
jgi:hypothetical protein